MEIGKKFAAADSCFAGHGSTSHVKLRCQLAETRYLAPVSNCKLVPLGVRIFLANRQEPWKFGEIFTWSTGNAFRKGVCERAAAYAFGLLPAG